MSETTEGLDKKLTTNYYSRLRFTQQLLPLLQSGSSHLARVVSVLSPGDESASIDFNNLDLKINFSLKNATNHAIAMTDFAFEEYAKANPHISFIHTFPGGVKTGWNKEAGLAMKAAFDLVFILGHPWMTPIDESGERHLYVATSAKYPPKSGSQSGVDTADESVMKGSDGESGSGAYLIGSTNEFRANEKVLAVLREKGAGTKIMAHTMGMFKAVRGS